MSWKLRTFTARAFTISIIEISCFNSNWCKFMYLIISKEFGDGHLKQTTDPTEPSCGLNIKFFVALECGIQRFDAVLMFDYNSLVFQVNEKSVNMQRTPRGKTAESIVGCTCIYDTFNVSTWCFSVPNSIIFRPKWERDFLETLFVPFCNKHFAAVLYKLPFRFQVFDLKNELDKASVRTQV